MQAHNPILRGFYPDPSVIRVGEDYYLANSTFFWWPGVAIHHSRDLVHWEALPSALNRASQLDLRGLSAAGGIWAPDLSWHEGKFFLVYTVVHSMYTLMYDTANYLVTAEHPEGPWSDPEPLPGFGFDPSLFFAPDGRSYLVFMVTDHRVPRKYAGRLLLQEYSLTEHRPLGEPSEIYHGEHIYLEGPHLYYHNGWYYLFAADTGTGEGHGQSLLRSRRIRGPYEMYQADFMERTSETEAWSLLTTRHDPAFPIQKCGHACLVDTPDGKWYALHLCGRPSTQRNPQDAPRFPGERRYPLGRETAIQEVEWTSDGWLRLRNGTSHPELTVDMGDAQPAFCGQEPGEKGRSVAGWRDDFQEAALSSEWLSPAIAQDEHHLSLRERPGWARLYGREGLASRYDQSMIARRVEELDFTVRTRVAFHPTSFKQLAGLILFYDYDNFLYLHITWDEDLGPCIAILRDENRRVSYPAGFVPLPPLMGQIPAEETEGGKEPADHTPEREPAAEQTIYLEAVSRGFQIQFWYGTSRDTLRPIGPCLDATFLSDEACRDGWFTGAVVGLAAQDLTGKGLPADFDFLEIDYRTEGEQ